MHIPQFYRWVVVNNSGQTLTYNSNGRLKVKLTGKSIDLTTGKVVYTQLPDDDMGFVAGDTIANGAEIVAGTEHSNVSTGYIGLDVQLEIIHDAGAAVAGTGQSFDLYISAGDEVGALESDASSYVGAEDNRLALILSVDCEPNMADDDIVRSKVASI